ncbi:hypothetical protein DQ04_03991030 [Trypanosoma grayi]|uniref:hypothetical protein n=1 Tax=Trypanosoma grayi TaxID=71804 RepID=UPI0004F40E88|nr:hypothetical protein DQ04_03991030 [Trypanosoma grayi]KEG10246.1 hypothetical protein DQ04_03991030 [Trypanosoma grayi]
MHDKDEKVVPLPLFKDVVGGSCCAVVVAAVSGDDAAGETTILRNAEKLRKVKNSPPRSGNLTRFMEFTKEHEKKCEAAAASATDSAEKARHERTLQKVRTMLADGKELMAKPEGTKPKVYAVARDPQAEERGGPLTKSSALRSQLQIADSESGSFANTGELWTGPAKIVVAAGPQTSKPVTKTMEIVIKGEPKKYDVEEYVERNKGGLFDSEIANHVQNTLGEGYNTAILGSELTPGLSVDKHAVWIIVQKILKGVLREAKANITNEFSVYMCVVKGREVLADLFGDSGRQPLVIANSPLFGSMVHGMTPKILKNGKDVGPAMAEALTKAKPLVKDDEYVVCTAILKQICEGDVKVSSLFATCALDMRPYVGVMEKNPAYSRQLIGQAFSGSCAPVLLVSYATLNDKAMEALNFQRKMMLPHLKSRGGSVKKFVEHMAGKVANAQEKAKKATDPKEKELCEAALKQLQKCVSDSKQLLKKPKETQPVAYLGQNQHHPQEQEPGSSNLKPGSSYFQQQEQNRSYTQQQQPQPQQGLSQPQIKPEKDAKEIDATIRVVAVLTEKRGAGQCDVTGDDNGFTVSVGGKSMKFPADEVVKRASHAASIRSSKVDALVDHFVGGFNVALLTADDDGFAVGSELLVRSTRSAFAKASAESEMYLMIAALKPEEDTAKDLQVDGANYEPRVHASSPLFGPCIGGAKLERVNTADAALTKIKSGLGVCETDKAVLFTLLVYKDINASEKDVVLSSFLTLLAGSNVQMYLKSLEAQQKERGVLHYALGGPCLTVCAVGLSTGSENADTALALGQVAKAVKGTSNSHVRSGGLKRFAMFSLKALTQLQVSLKNATGHEKERIAKSNANVEAVLKDAEEMLRDPKDRPPKVYKQLH